MSVIQRAEKGVLKCFGHMERMTKRIYVCWNTLRIKLFLKRLDHCQQAKRSKAVLRTFPPPKQQFFLLYPYMKCILKAAGFHAVTSFEAECM